MYTAMLDRVITAIRAVTQPTPDEKYSEMFNMLFAPEDYLAQLEEKARKQKLVNNLIAGATVVAASLEIAHIARQSNFMKKLKK